MKPIDSMPSRDPEIWRPTDDGMHVRAVHELERPKPGCAHCSAVYARKTGAPARCLVERCLVYRELARVTDAQHVTIWVATYKAIVSCHGAHDVITLGPNPSERSIAALTLY